MCVQLRVYVARKEIRRGVGGGGVLCGVCPPLQRLIDVGYFSLALHATHSSPDTHTHTEDTSKPFQHSSTHPQSLHKQEERKNEKNLKFPLPLLRHPSSPSARQQARTAHRTCSIHLLLALLCFPLTVANNLLVSKDIEEHQRIRNMGTCPKILAEI